jgi:hypothetical protein
MIDINKGQSGRFKQFAWLLFVLLMTYLLLRAYFLEPLNDEVFTLFYFIETGVLWGSDVLLDANNHLLNSFLGRGIYLLFGDDFFYLRLPNIIAFVFYFWGIVRFIKPLQSALFKVLILLGTTCIPFILEYFAYSRGYGISLGLFVFSLSFIRDFVANRNIRSSYISVFLLCIAVYANLSFILPLVLLMLLFLLIQWMYKSELKTKQHLFLFLNYVILIVLMLPIIKFASDLRENEALYYGSLRGLWSVTGNSLSHNILFYDRHWLKYLFITFLLLMSAQLIYRWSKIGGKQFFTESTTVLAWFLWGNLVAVVLMAEFLGINYPQDRVGMYFAILFLLSLSFIIYQYKKLHWLMLGMLFFPISFFPRINLTTSVFSPGDRIPQGIFDEVNSQLDSYSTIYIDPLQKLTWSYHSRKLDSPNFILTQEDFSPTSDVILTYSEFYNDKHPPKDYEVIAYDKESSTIAFKRKSISHKKVIYRLPFEALESQDEYISIFSSDSIDDFRNKKIQFHITAEMSAENKDLDFAFFTYSTYDKAEKNIDYNDLNLRMIYGRKEEFLLNFNYEIDQLKPNENEIRIYIWNPKHEKISLKNGVFEILELIDAH